MRFTICLRAFALASVAALFSPVAAHAEQFFDHPNHPAGNRLDWCLTWGSNCGKPAADEFCRRNNFQTSIGFAPDPGIGFTRVLQDNRMVCNGEPCDGFLYIVCN